MKNEGKSINLSRGRDNCTGKHSNVTLNGRQLKHSLNIILHSNIQTCRLFIPREIASQKLKRKGNFLFQQQGGINYTDRIDFLQQELISFVNHRSKYFNPSASKSPPLFSSFQPSNTQFFTRKILSPRIISCPLRIDRRKEKIEQAEGSLRSSPQSRGVSPRASPICASRYSLARAAGRVQSAPSRERDNLRRDPTRKQTALRILALSLSSYGISRGIVTSR